MSRNAKIGIAVIIIGLIAFIVWRYMQKVAAANQAAEVALAVQSVMIAFWENYGWPDGVKKLKEQGLMSELAYWSAKSYVAKDATGGENFYARTQQKPSAWVAAKTASNFDDAYFAEYIKLYESQK